ncbi:MAG: nucleotidyltransferase domain-containing protein [Treponema sp.]|nr:nucleotidyltransferase domain-containing protein [Treponema sp.]
MRTVIQNELNELVSAITETVAADAVILFGSFAYGTPTDDSDIDLYVVVADKSIRPLEAMQKISEAVGAVQKRPVDILVGSESAFHERQAHATIEKEVSQKGIRLFTRNGSAFGEKYA